MKVLPVAFDSMGVRSMATFVKTKDLSIFIDPSAALGARRYGLPPHPYEEKALKRAHQRISFFLSKADIVVVTHYHFDHFRREGYSQKVLLKDFNLNINKSQKNRALNFAKNVDYEVADGRTFCFGSTELVFSPPLPHGEDGTKLGYVLAVAVKSDQTLVFSSDVQGPISEVAKDWIISQDPDILIMDGPPTYLRRVLSENNLRRAIENFKEILHMTSVHTVILDHHLVRDKGFPDRFPVFCEGNILTAAEFIGLPPCFLEAWRRELWKVRSSS